MSDLIKNIMLANLGIISVSKKKAEELARDLIKEGALSETEGAKFTKDLITKSEEISSDINKKIEETVAKSLKRLDLPTHRDLEDIKQKLDKLAKQKKD